MNLVREALTSPSACRDYDYERLEFYGDSIAGFLVILELFLTRPTYVEGDLDHERINKVQNTRFFKVNRE
jgi:dsRNA-specific ribonuclease